MDNMNDELQRFKTSINLVGYAASCGYEVDTRKSTKKGTVMRRESDNSKILVGVTHGDRWIFHSFRDRSHKGTIIDFVKNERGLSLGQVRQELRRYAGEYKPDSGAGWKQKHEPVNVATEIDRTAIAAAYAKTKTINKSLYLQHRGLHPSTLQQSRFKNIVRFDENRNVVFPHYDMGGLCGYEKKNQGFTGFSTGGKKGVWCSCNIKTANTLIIVEASIDALSHAQLLQTGQGTAYISVGGALSQNQFELLAEIFDRRPNIKRVILATDNDAAGDKVADTIRSIIPIGVDTARSIPAIGKDWNDALTGQNTSGKE